VFARIGHRCCPEFEAPHPPIPSSTLPSQAPTLATASPPTSPRPARYSARTDPEAPLPAGGRWALVAVHYGSPLHRLRVPFVAVLHQNADPGAVEVFGPARTLIPPTNYFCCNLCWIRFFLLHASLLFLPVVSPLSYFPHLFTQRLDVSDRSPAKALTRRFPS